MADPITIGLALWSIYKAVKKGEQISDIKGKLDEVKEQYEHLKDKRRKPGPAMRKCTKKLEDAIEKKGWGLLLTVLPGGDLCEDVMEALEELQQGIDELNPDLKVEKMDEWEWNQLAEKVAEGSGKKKLKKIKK